MGIQFGCCESGSNKNQVIIDQIIKDDNKYYSKAENSKMTRLVLKKSYDMRKVRFIQKMYRSRFSRKKFLKNKDTLNKFFLLEMNANILKNLNEIEAHLGEKFSAEMEKEGKIGKYTNTEYYRVYCNNWKYSLKLPPCYVDPSHNSDIYFGSWSIDKKFQGYGILYKSDGCKFEGMWENGIITGHGRYFTPTREFFEGNFINGFAYGKGQFIHNDGTVYRGQWYYDQPHGEGEEFFSDGSHFQGIFKYGKKISGKFTWEDGSFYEGEVNNDMFHGIGKYHWKEGREYEGYWVEGQMSGQGTITYMNGTVYCGDFASNQRSGKGRYTWNDTKYYEGGWLNGKPHGIGRYMKNGKVIEGVWINGKLKSKNKNALAGIVSTPASSYAPSIMTDVNEVTHDSQISPKVIKKSVYPKKVN